MFHKFFFNVYLFLRQRETEHERGRGRERGRHRIRNRLQALSHQPRARRGARTHGPRDRDLAEVGRLTDCATQAPLDVFFGEVWIHVFCSFLHRLICFSGVEFVKFSVVDSLFCGSLLFVVVVHLFFLLSM